MIFNIRTRKNRLKQRQKFIIDLFLILILLLYPIVNFGQYISQDQKDYIKEKSKNILVNYEQYFNLTGDINEPFGDRESVFKKEFLNLFSNKNIFVYNDLDPESKTSEKFTVESYAMNIMSWYSATGIRCELKLNDIKYSSIEKLNTSKYYIDLTLDKYISGTYLSNYLHRKTYTLSIRIGFNKTERSYTNFEIVGIQSSEPVYKPKPTPKPKPYTISSNESSGLILDETFIDNRNNWANNRQDENYMCEISNGYYTLEHFRTTYGYSFPFKIDIQTYEDFKIETSIKKISGILDNGYGLVFGRKDANNQYYFVINGNGSWKLSEMKNGNRTNIKDWTRTDAVNKGNGSINTLKVVKSASSMKYYINNNLVYTGTFKPFFGNEIGFIIYDDQKIAIDYLKVYNSKTTLQKIFHEEFTDNRNNWNTGNDEIEMMSIENGFYYFEHKRNTSGRMVSKSIDLNTAKDFKIETLIKKISGIQDHGYGISFGRKDNDNDNYFYVNGNGSYQVITYNGGVKKVLKSWTKSDAINKGNGVQNKLAIVKTGNTVKYFINDKEVFDTDQNRFFGNSVSYLVYREQKIAVDYLHIDYTD